MAFSVAGKFRIAKIDAASFGSFCLKQGEIIEPRGWTEKMAHGIPGTIGQVFQVKQMIGMVRFFIKRVHI